MNSPNHKGKHSNIAIQVLLVSSTILVSWFGMMIVHECGHVLHAWVSGGVVKKVVLHPLTISRTDLSVNPHPLFVIWGGLIWGCILPLLLWGVSGFLKWSFSYLFQFFAGFCLIANGVYLGAGSFGKIGDAGDLLYYGTSQWVLILVGLVSSATGLLLWHGLGRYFGCGKDKKEINFKTSVAVFMLLLLVVGIEIMVNSQVD
ncbi:hypothetical protein ACFL54_06065 [Planctomycetota bacterium]